VARSVIVVDKRDNVATALRRLEQGASIRVEMEGFTIGVTLAQAIPLGHKFALKDIEVGEPIIKYGEVIGLATGKIKRGEHTHVHNVEGLRGRGDRQ
jgi:altronate dehydratase small subunit